MRLKISEAAKRTLKYWLNEVMHGRIPLSRLPLEVASFYHAGWAAGMAFAKAQAREYEHQLDVAYLQAYSPKERQEEIQRRLDEHFRRVDAEFFGGESE